MTAECVLNKSLPSSALWTRTVAMSALQRELRRGTRTHTHTHTHTHTQTHTQIEQPGNQGISRENAEEVRLGQATGQIGLLGSVSVV